MPAGSSSVPISEAVMWDAIFIGAGLAFFAIAAGYTLICGRL
jgi:hypothetical protein